MKFHSTLIITNALERKFIFICLVSFGSCQFMLCTMTHNNSARETLTNLRLSWRLESGFKAAVLCILCKVITNTMRFN